MRQKSHAGSVSVGVPPASDCAVSVLIFTLNEELNLDHCLDSLQWCDDTIVVDSFSTDKTLDICKKRQIRSVSHVFSGFGDQRNWALRTVPLKHDWVLILDADERVPTALAIELNHIGRAAAAPFDAYRVKRRFHLWGRWLRHSSLYPTWVVRFVQRSRVQYKNRGHSETQEVDGQIGELSGFLIDENHKSIEEWFERQGRYARQEAQFEVDTEQTGPGLVGLISKNPMRRREAVKQIASKIPFRGPMYFLYCYVLRLGFLDGTDGFVFCRMKAMYQSMIAVSKHDIKTASRSAKVNRV